MSSRIQFEDDIIFSSYPQHLNQKSTRKRDFDLSPATFGSKTRSGLTIASGKQQGIGNMEEADYRIQKALKNMVQQRSQILSDKKKKLVSTNSAKSILKKSKVLVKEEPILHPIQNLDDASLRYLTRRLVNQPKYKSMGSIKATSEIHTDFNDPILIDHSDISSRITLQDRIIDSTPTPPQPTPLPSKETITDEKIDSKEDQLFKLSNNVEVKKIDNSNNDNFNDLLQDLQQSKLRIYNLLNIEPIKPKIEFIKKKNEDFFHIHKNEAVVPKKTVVIDSKCNKTTTKIDPLIIEAVCFERMQRLNYIKKAVDIKEWKLIQKSVKYTRDQLFNTVVKEVDNELEQLVNEMLLVELK